MISSLRELISLGLADEILASVIRGGDWYLVGSRALGTADDLSDWDTMVFVDERSAGGQPSSTHLERAFAVQRPHIPWPPDLAGHVRWRGAAAVELVVMDPSACAHREDDDLPSWAHELACAVPLRIGTGVGEEYRAGVADRFAAQARRLADREYRDFRLARNQAVSALARPDRATQAMTCVRCAGCAARFWLLSSGQPYPSEKWLLTVLERTESGSTLPGSLRQVLDANLAAAARFDALWELWRLVDERAQQAGIDASLLAGSPFAKG